MAGPEWLESLQATIVPGNASLPNYGILVDAPADFAGKPAHRLISRAAARHWRDRLNRSNGEYTRYGKYGNLRTVALAGVAVIALLAILRADSESGPRHA